MKKGDVFTTSVSASVNQERSQYVIKASDGRTIVPSLELDETQYSYEEDVEAIVQEMIAQNQDEGGIISCLHKAGDPVREGVKQPTCTKAGSYEEVIY